MALRLSTISKLTHGWKKKTIDKFAGFFRKEPSLEGSFFSAGLREQKIDKANET